MITNSLKIPKSLHFKNRTKNMKTQLNTPTQPYNGLKTNDKFFFAGTSVHKIYAGSQKSLTFFSAFQN